MFEYEISDISTSELARLALSHGWKERPCQQDGVRMLELPDEPVMQIVLATERFSDARQVNRRAAETFALWLLRQAVEKMRRGT